MADMWPAGSRHLHPDEWPTHSPSTPVVSLLDLTQVSMSFNLILSVPAIMNWYVIGSNMVTMTLRGLK
jgi:hypothetical protein